MSPKKLKVFFVAAEAIPYASIGGFASVVTYLSRALVQMGHEVSIFMPKFGFIEEEKHKLEMVYEGLNVPTDDEATPYLICNVKKAGVSFNGATVYFLENNEYYEQRANVYGYADDPTRWALLSRGLLEFLKASEITPDVIHCHDWHTGLVPDYLKKNYNKDKNLSSITTVFTIHNLQFQGMFDHRNVSELDFDDGKSFVASMFSPQIKKQNFMRRGIMHSNAVTTVSKTYAKEILTPMYGEKLDKLLLEIKEKLFGIVNGIDYTEFNPAMDKMIEHNYDAETIERRSLNKIALQDEFDLPKDPDALLLGFVGRLDYQKGVDLIIKTLPHVFDEYNVQFVQIGGGDSTLVNGLKDLKEKFPTKVGILPYPNFTLPRLLFAGSDCVVFPSRFEPCGLVQLEAMRYGSIPIVRKVGGLVDTVQNFDSITGQGTGFSFANFDEFSLFGQIVRAKEIHNNKDLWRKLQLNAMSLDFSWDYSSREYSKLYDRAIELKTKPNAKRSTYSYM